MMTIVRKDFKQGAIMVTFSAVGVSEQQVTLHV